MMTRMKHPQRDEGLTLIELIVAAALLGLVFTALGGILISLLVTERTVAGVAQGATAAQLTATSINERIRNSSEFAVTTVGGDELLVARVAGTADDLEWTCHAWYYSAADDGQIRSTSGPDGTEISVPTAAALAEWTLLLDGVTPVAGSPVFTPSGSRLEVRFDATAGESPPIAIRLTAVGLTATAEGASCY